jgi:PAS domain S-box-containing protein
MKSVDHSVLLNLKGQLAKSAANDNGFPIPLSNLIIENSHLGIAIINAKEQCVYANNELAKIVGYRVDEIVGTNYKNYLTEAQNKKNADLYARRQKGEILPNRYESEFYQKGGGRRIAEVTANLVNISGDDQPCIILQIFDITERKKIENELDKSQKKYLDLCENAFDIIYSHDLNGIFVEINTPDVLEVGGTHDEISKMDIRDLIPERIRKEFDDYLNRIKKNGKDEALMIIQTDSGEEKILEYRNSLIYDDKQHPVGVSGAARDITQHVKDKKSLKASEEKFRLLFESIDECAFELDLSGNFVFFNKALMKHTGYSKDELIRMNYREYVHPDDNDKAVEFFKRLYRAGKAKDVLIFKGIRKDGDIRYLETTAALIHDDYKNIIGFRGITRDITLRELTEKVLKENEQRLREIIEGSPFPMFVINEKYLVTHLNDAFSDMAGISKKEILGTALPWGGESFPLLRRVLAEQVVDGASINTIKKLYTKAHRISPIMKGGYELEAFIEQIDKWVYVTAVPIRGADGKIVGAVETILDITEKKQAEVNLQKSEKKYRDLFQSIHDFIFIHDLDGNFIETNMRYAAEVGYTSEVISNYNIKDLIPERFRDKFDKYLIRILKNGSDEGLISVMMPDDTERTLEYKNFLIYDDENHPVSVLGSARDITSHLNDKQTLAISEEKYRTIIESINDVYFEVDLEGNYTFFNEELLQHFGLNKEEIIGLNYSSYIVPDDKEKVFKFFNNIYKTGEIGRNLQFRFAVEDRVNIEVELTASLIKDSNGNPVGFRGITRDITKKKRAEKNLLKMHEALESKVTERTKDLQNTNTALEVLLNKRENDKRDLEERVAFSIKEVITPYLELLKKTPLDKHQAIYLDALETNFLEIASPFMEILSDSLQKLTPTEIQVINLIKQNKISKEIADFLGISSRTVESHRDNIRKKLGIKNKKINLRTYLLSFK